MNMMNYRYDREASINELLKTRNLFYRDLKKAFYCEFSKEETEEYVHELCSNAKCLYMRDELYLPLTETDDMHSDARVDFLFTPTYIGTAFIMLAVMDWPELMSDSDISETLSKLMKGCCGRNFYGHGYEEDEKTLGAMDIFSYSITGAFIEKYPKLCPEFNTLYRMTCAIGELAASRRLKKREYIRKGERLLERIRMCATCVD